MPRKRLMLLICLRNIAETMFRNVLADSIFLYNWTEQWCLRLAWPSLWTWSRLKICRWCWWSLSLGWISGLSSGYCPDKSRKNHTRIRWTHQPCAHCEASVPVWPTLIILSLSNRWWASHRCRLCRWPLYRDGIQDPGRAGWQHARSTSELSYHWHQVSRRCHVFILWEFNPPFRMDQALCRQREALQISVASHTSSWECLENNPRDAGILNKGCFIGDHETINVCVLPLKH